MINFIFQQAPDIVKKQVLVMNTYFYPMVKDPNQFPDERMMRGIRKAGLSTDTHFVIVPINLLEKGHWSMAIIANVNLCMDPLETTLTVVDNNGQPCMCYLYMDSLFRIDEEIRKTLNRACTLFMKANGHTPQ